MPVLIYSEYATIVFPLFFFQHKPTLCVCGWTCICAYMCCEWEQRHRWGLGFLSEDLLQASQQHARDGAWIRIIFQILFLSSLPHIHTNVHNVGSNESTHGKFWYPSSALMPDRCIKEKYGHDYHAFVA